MSVTEPPGQIAEAEALMLILGAALTVMILDAMAVHPFAPVPVTVYVVVDEGLTVILDDVDPLLHT